MTPAPSLERIQGLAFGTLTTEQKLENKNSFTWADVAVSVLLILVVISV